MDGIAIQRQAATPLHESLIAIPVSAGEVLDKMTILALKIQRVRDERKRRMAAQELDLLRRATAPLSAGDAAGEIAELTAKLEQINGALWEVEDQLRALEAAQDFGAVFVEAARSVYRLNDQRARLKNAVNAAVGSAIVEVKEHPAY